MKRTPLLCLAIAASTFASPVRAQNVAVTEQNVGICAGSHLSTFGAWIAVTVGQACNSNSVGNDWSSGSFEWSFNDEPVDFNSHYFTRIRKSGPGEIVSEEPLVGVLTKDNGPNGNGPDGNGPPGNGPHGDGPPGNGPDGNGPPGKGPDGNGPPGPPNNTPNNNIAPTVVDPLNDLVNQTNAAPEPATMLLVASGLAGVGALARRRRKGAQ